MKGFIEKVSGDKYITDYRGVLKIGDKIIEVENGERLLVDSFDNICTVTSINYVGGYLHKSSGNEITVDKYEELVTPLKDKGYMEDGVMEFDNLDDEYAYRKFTQKYQTIRKTKQVVSDPKLIPLVTYQMSTENRYIQSLYALGASNSEGDNYQYNQQQAWENIVRECFTELGMGYVDNISYSQTKNKRVWSNSTHSGIRYVVAFGKYVFNDKYDKKRSHLRGSLESMKANYEADKKSIREVIISQYNTHFGTIDEGKFNFAHFRNELSSIKNKIYSMDYKKKDYSSWSATNTKAHNLLKYLDQYISENHKD